MQLTRKVLIEKCHMFSEYNNPECIPVELWKKSYAKLMMCSDACVFIADILCKIMKTNECKFALMWHGHNFYHPTYTFTINNLEEFTIPLESINIVTKLPSCDCGYDMLKTLICATWDNKKLISVKNV